MQPKNIKLFLKYDLGYSHVKRPNYHDVAESSNRLIHIISGCMFTAGLFASIQPCITVKFPALNRAQKQNQAKRHGIFRANRIIHSSLV